MLMIIKIFLNKDNLFKYKNKMVTVFGVCYIIKFWKFYIVPCPLNVSKHLHVIKPLNLDNIVRLLNDN